MRRDIIKLAILLLSFSISSLRAQIIMKVVSGYVLIDTDTNIGKLNEKIRVYRLRGNDVVPVGKIKLLKFQGGKAAGKILKENRGYTILKGDFVSEKNKKNLGYSLSRSPQPIPGNRTEIPKPSPNKTDRFGVHIGRFLPSSHLENNYIPSFTIGAYAKLLTFWNHSIFVDITYPFLKMPTDRTSNIETSLFLAHLVDHIRMGNRIHFDVGGGLYYSKWEDSISGEIGSNSNLGFFIGFSMDFFNPIGLTFTPMIRYHNYHQESNWVEFVVGGLNLSYSF